MERQILPYILQDLSKKMVFVGGPRQVGKTTLAENISKEYEKSIILNWDDTFDKQKIIKRNWDDDTTLIVLDEIHKYRPWKSWLKGIFDKQKNIHKFLITGSARLDLYKKGGDSLLGRYHYWRLHPLTLFEHPSNLSNTEVFNRLMKLGGFPEPFLENTERFARRWRQERYEKIIREDIRDLENVKDIQLMSLLLEMLRSRVGAPVVVSNIAKDLSISPNTVLHWIEIFEKMYLIFRVSGYSQNINRAVSKPFKVYFYDNADVLGDDGAVFENLVANHLLRQIHFFEDSQGFRYKLSYLRDKEGHEIDFIVTKNSKILEMIEVKFSDEVPSSHLYFFKTRYPAIRVTQLLGRPSVDRIKNEIAIKSAHDFFSSNPTLWNHWLN